MHGKSSWIKEYECIHSTAAHKLIIWLGLILKIFDELKMIVDLIFFPPNKVPYFITGMSSEYFCVLKYFLKHLKDVSETEGNNYNITIYMKYK